ncbi:hypothetical protein KEM48_006891 [Puccinia striiformis f. sp. tritici PST-130]|nr:hypothetical protein KEM48_006891 [Puccinia striiformis f. sp. tritici PST-130]
MARFNISFSSSSSPRLSTYDVHNLPESSSHLSSQAASSRHRKESGSSVLTTDTTTTTGFSGPGHKPSIGSGLSSRRTPSGIPFFSRKTSGNNNQSVINVSEDLPVISPSPPPVKTVRPPDQEQRPSATNPIGLQISPSSVSHPSPRMTPTRREISLVPTLIEILPAKSSPSGTHIPLGIAPPQKLSINILNGASSETSDALSPKNPPWTVSVSGPSKEKVAMLRSATSSDVRHQSTTSHRVASITSANSNLVRTLKESTTSLRKGLPTIDASPLRMDDELSDDGTKASKNPLTTAPVRQQIQSDDYIKLRVTSSRSGSEHTNEFGTIAGHHQTVTTTLNNVHQETSAAARLAAARRTVAKSQEVHAARVAHDGFRLPRFDSQADQSTVSEFGASMTNTKLLMSGERFHHQALVELEYLKFINLESVYRSPEVILGMNYHMAIDMWSLGCILAELYTGYPIFPGETESEQLACIMEVLGMPDKYLIDRSSRRKLFFDSTGSARPIVNSKGRRRRVGSKTLQSVLKSDDELFVDFISKCLAWDPERRLKPDPAMRHPWILAGRSRQPISQSSNLHTHHHHLSSSATSSSTITTSSSLNNLGSNSLNTSSSTSGGAGSTSSSIGTGAGRLSHGRFNSGTTSLNISSPRRNSLNLHSNSLSVGTTNGLSSSTSTNANSNQNNSSSNTTNTNTNTNITNTISQKHTQPTPTQSNSIILPSSISNLPHQSSTHHHPSTSTKISNSSSSGTSSSGSFTGGVAGNAHRTDDHSSSKLSHPASSSGNTNNSNTSSLTIAHSSVSRQSLPVRAGP